jgi:hypothetical protein
MTAADATARLDLICAGWFMILARYVDTARVPQKIHREQHERDEH